MSATFKNKIMSFSHNEEGVDYVLGDIHGRFDLVEESLNNVDFDIEKDRLFCVGDLIDRGPYSAHVIEFLKLPFIHAVRGNHEDMLLDFYEKNPFASDEEFYEVGVENGMTWFLEQSLEERAEILQLLSQLPLVIEIDSPRGLVGLVHADVPRNISWDEFKKEIMDDNQKVIETALWGRNRLNYNIEQDIEGLGRLYVGHTVQANVKKLGNVVALDTGAVFNRHLSMVNIICQSQVLNQPNKVKNNLFNITSQTTSPFGKMK